LAVIPLATIIDEFDVLAGAISAGSFLWLLTLYVRALAELTKRSWPACLAIFLVSSMITGGVVDAVTSRFIASFKVNGAAFAPSLKPGERVLANTSVFRLLGEGEYFILGDNRCNSYDSRFRGPVRAPDILGKIYYRFLPLQAAGYLE
jgi:hypothetical protein